jgi:opacity protein-like surface antigen
MSKNKLLVGAVLLGLSSAALASGAMPAAPEFNPGLYIGAQAGWALADEGNGFKDAANAIYDFGKKNGLNSSVDTEQGGFGGRLFLGYMFMRNFGLEAGYTFLPDNKYDVQVNGLDQNAKFKSYVIDLMAKGVLPLDENWDLFAKLGVAYVHGEWDANSLGENFSNSNGQIRPAYGLGIAYNFNSNFGIDLSYTGTYGTHRVDYNELLNAANVSDINPIPTTHLVAIGVTYKFDM